MKKEEEKRKFKAFQCLVELGLDDNTTTKIQEVINKQDLMVLAILTSNASPESKKRLLERCINSK